MSFPKYWVYSCTTTTAFGINNKKSISSSSATSTGNNLEKTIALANSISKKKSELIAFKQLDGRIKTYNTNVITNSSLLENVEYSVPNLNKIYLWQGAKNIDKKTLLLCGASFTYNGCIYIGSICEIKNPNNYIYLNVPNANKTSLYGPNYNYKKNIYNLVGSCKFDLTNDKISDNIMKDINDYKLKNIGFIYTGSLSKNDIEDKLNYNYLLPSNSNKIINKITYIHSVTDKLCALNTGTAKCTKSYLYNIDKNNYTEIIFDSESKTTTTYGIWHNNDDTFTIVGCYSNIQVGINDIYNSDGQPKPYGNAFIMDCKLRKISIDDKSYNDDSSLSSSTCSLEKKEEASIEKTSLQYEFYNKTTIKLPNSIISHITGISQFFNSKNKYSLSFNELINNELIGHFIVIKRSNILNRFNIIYNKKLNNLNFGASFVSCNSVANNIIIGISDGINPVNYTSTIPYQATINDIILKHDV